MTSASNTPVGSARSIFLVRLQMAASASVVLGGVLAGILFLAALFSRQPILGRAAVVALSVSIFGLALAQAWRVWWLRRSGSWRGLSGERISRDQQPRQFRVWLTTHLLLVAIHLAWAALLMWIAFASRF
jgi:hypothetical protein